MKLLLLGGTGEARSLAQELSRSGVHVVSSLAGRTTDARLPVGEVRHGGFGGVEGLIDWLRDNAVDALVDATHPFAATMTSHAAAAARELDLPFLVLRRPGWTATKGDIWHWVDSPDAAARLLPDVGSRAFLTIGRQGLHEFAGVGVWMLARCVDPPEPVPTWCELILDRGPYDVPGELSVLREHDIDVLVTKDSGGPQTSAKLVAARQLGVPVIVIRRPPLPAGVQAVESATEVLAWVRVHVD
ncbi:cobalt-precorrin-6A reductase [Kribbella sp. NPDC050124]|uniref:cobalt-precorrin-6A reductase n=1 Tax=Kribbella sp. NPDC050124 TaxID=3364114 RepID=UPI0037B62C63